MRQLICQHNQKFRSHIQLDAHLYTKKSTPSHGAPDTVYTSKLSDCQTSQKGQLAPVSPLSALSGTAIGEQKLKDICMLMHYFVYLVFYSSEK